MSGGGETSSETVTGTAVRMNTKVVVRMVETKVVESKSGLAVKRKGGVGFGLPAAHIIGYV